MKLVLRRLEREGNPEKLTIFAATENLSVMPQEGNERENPSGTCKATLNGSYEIEIYVGVQDIRKRLSFFVLSDPKESVRLLAETNVALLLANRKASG